MAIASSPSTTTALAVRPGRATSGRPSGSGQHKGACSRRRCPARNRTKPGARSGRHGSRFPRPIRVVRFRPDIRLAPACRPATRSMSRRPPGGSFTQAQATIVQQRQNHGRPGVTNNLQACSWPSGPFALAVPRGIAVLETRSSSRQLASRCLPELLGKKGTGTICRNGPEAGTAAKRWSWHKNGACSPFLKLKYPPLTRAKAKPYLPDTTIMSGRSPIAQACLYSSGGPAVRPRRVRCPRFRLFARSLLRSTTSLGKSNSTICPERPEGCFAHRVPVPLSPCSTMQPTSC